MYTRVGTAIAIVYAMGAYSANRHWGCLNKGRRSGLFKGLLSFIALSLSDLASALGTPHGLA